MLAINKTTAAKLFALRKIPALLLLIIASEVSTSSFTQLRISSANKSPKNWFEWTTQNSYCYSIEYGDGKFVRFTIAPLHFITIGSFDYMTTI